MSYSVSQLATAVMQHLALLDANEPIASADETYINDVWAAKWEEISANNSFRGEGMTYFAYSSIPNAVFLIVRDLVANEVRGAFGLPISATEKDMEEAVILKRLRRHLQTRSSEKSVKAKYY